MSSRLCRRFGLAKRQQSLEKNAYKVTIVQEALTSLADDVTATKRMRELQDGPVLAVCDHKNDAKVSGLHLSA
jgi:hypothetical protein